MEEWKMFKTIDDFLELWRNEADFTRKIFDGLTDESLKQQVTEEHRNLGRLAWHLTITLEEMMGHAGLEFDRVKPDEPIPQSAAEITEAYRKSNEAMIAALKEQWNDNTLTEEREMYGDKWTVSEVLWTLVSHQIHHRGQMTVLMRQAGLKVPGLYGPAKEDWAEFGTEAPNV